MLLHIVDGGKSMENQKDPQAVNVGVKIRALRKIRGISLQQMAEEMNMSYSFLSGLENGKHSISLTNLQRFASYFGVDMVYFLQTRKGSTVLVRGEEAFAENITEDGVVFNVVSPEDSPRLQLAYVSMPAHPTTERHIHRHRKGQEVLSVMEGSVTVMVEEKKYILNAGDSLLYAADVEHVIFTEDTPAKFTIIVSPPYSQNVDQNEQNPTQ